MSAVPQSEASGTSALAVPKKVKATKPKAPKTMSIGVVLERLRQEFDDITVSKIRFLESEGLVSPQRTASGYRRFTEADVERLRYILVTQRDNYLPLKVIREQLEAMDAGTVTSLLRSEVSPLISPENFRAPVASRLTAEDVANQANVRLETVAEMVKVGLIKADLSGFFTADDVRIVSTCMALEEFGFDVRQLRSLRNSAVRQADLIAQVAAPIAHSRSDVARERAAETSQNMTALVVSLHASLVKNALRDQLG
ncbi:transcriptional regulator FtsR [Corynebacterium epidermidicanis]|uniref:MerR family regulatory protein n=1 Tax=Corynebacterium epidermidicanis TaxID=1050174 RepID=A0A0G3GPD2_9CORY|nr:MerR family transcriptional regulator [Corynebacterium epidermidicanis]AKK03086.1 MerR family regulatory protein [Corynebacterium epidermidicanis]